MRRSAVKRVARAAVLVALVAATGMLAAPPAGALAGGPDAFGYKFKDSAEPGGPAFNFEDISATGTPIFLGDDQVSGAIPIGFAFNFYGTDFTSAFVSSNGFVTFTATFSNGCCSGQSLPNATAPNNLIAGYWEDLHPGSGGSVRFQTLGTAPSRRLIVQFTDVPHFGGGNLVTMQFKLFESSSAIEVHYLSAPSDGGQHSAGIEDATGTIGLQYLFGSFSLSSTAVRYSVQPDVVLGGRATVARVEVTDPTASGLDQTVVGADTGDVVTEDSSVKDETVVAVGGPTVSGSGLKARVETVAGDVPSSHAAAALAEATILVPGGPLIEVAGVRSRSDSTCGGATGDVDIGYLAVDGTVLIDGSTSPPPNTAVGLVTLNEQAPVAGADQGLLVNAIHVAVPGVVDVVIGSARSDVHNCA